MSISRTSSCSNQRKHYSLERRPKMLKDFLTEHDLNSCPSSGFKSYPRRVDHQEHHDDRDSVRNLIQMDLDYVRKTSKGLQRSRAKAASATISVIQALINSVKSIQFTAVKSPSILPRSLSRRLLKRNIHHAQKCMSSSCTDNDEVEMITTVKIKDIIRWKSFRDLMEENSQSQLSDLHHHLPSSPDHHTTTSCSSNASSWCDSDFTSEYLPSCSGNPDDCNENDVEMGKKYLPFVGRDSQKATTTESPTLGPKDDLACDEKEQRSPMSVIDYDDDQFEEDTRYDEEDEVEETAKLLLNHVKASTSLMKNCKDSVLEQMLLDFFVEELSTERNQSMSSDEMIRKATAWMNGEEQSGTMELEKCLGEMDRKDRWSKFEEEQEVIGLQIENGLLNVLLDELLADLLLC